MVEAPVEETTAPEPVGPADVDSAQAQPLVGSAPNSKTKAAAPVDVQMKDAPPAKAASSVRVLSPTISLAWL